MKVYELAGIILASLMMGILLGAYFVHAVERWKGPGGVVERGEPKTPRPELPKIREFRNEDGEVGYLFVGLSEDQAEKIFEHIKEKRGE